MPLSYGMSYHIAGACSFTNGSSYYVTSLPMPSAKENHAIANKLGRHGFQRIQQFREYEPGWDFGRGQPMSEIALRLLGQFLHTATFPADKKPSVFLTTSGNLELAWENPPGLRIQAEFAPDRIEYYREDTGAEESLGHGDVNRVASLLSK